MNQDWNKTPSFRPLNSGLRGVGGWLGLFIIGVTILRPFWTLAEFSDPKNADISKLADAFPRTMMIFTIEKVLMIHLLLFGIAVGIALWKFHTPFSVKLTKIYLIANPLVIILGLLLIKLSDLPPTVQDRAIGRGLPGVAVVALWSMIWLLYFVKSERVRATYLESFDRPL